MKCNKTCDCEEEFEDCASEDENDQQADEMKPIKNNQTCTCDECICEVDPEDDFLSNGDLIY